MASELLGRRQVRGMSGILADIAPRVDGLVRGGNPNCVSGACETVDALPQP